jgi:hypothetical protein
MVQSLMQTLSDLLSTSGNIYPKLKKKTPEEPPCWTFNYSASMGLVQLKKGQESILLFLKSFNCGNYVVDVRGRMNEKE